MISVIVPVYNVEKYLRQCLDSVLAQTYRELEIILVDDGSTDSSGAICDEYATRDSRIKVVHQQNGGLSSARNAGLDLATGEYVAFVDSDDYIHETMLELLYQALVENNADTVICNFERVDEKGDVISVRSLQPLTNGVVSMEEALENLATPNHVIWVVVWNKLYKSELLKNLRFPLGKLCEDNFFSYKVFYACKTICTVADKLYYYRSNKDSITYNVPRPILNLFELEAILEKLRFFKKRRIYGTLRRETNSFHYLFCKTLEAYRPDARSERRRISALRWGVLPFILEFWKDFGILTIINFAFPNLFALLSKLKKSVRKILLKTERNNSIENQ